MAAMGRPRKSFNRRIADEVCARIAFSADGLVKVLSDINAEANPGVKPEDYQKVVTLHQIWTWLDENADFSKRYARARAVQAEFLGDMQMGEALASRIGEYRKKTRDKKGVESVEVRQEDNVPRSRLICDVIDRRMKQLSPKKYRDTGSSQGEDTGNEELQNLAKILAAGPAPTDPDDPSVNLGTTKPDFNEPEKADEETKADEEPPKSEEPK